MYSNPKITLICLASLLVLVVLVKLPSCKKITNDYKEKAKNNLLHFMLHSFCLRQPGGSFGKLPPGPPQKLLVKEDN